MAIDSGAAGQAWELFFSETGLARDCTPEAFELAKMLLRIKRPDLVQNFHLDVSVSITRQAFSDIFKTAPPAQRDRTLSKLSLRIPAVMERSMRFTIFPDNSSFIRVKSRHWRAAASIFERAREQMASAGADAIAHTMGRLAYGARQRDSFFPATPLATAAQLRGICEIGELAEIPDGSSSPAWKNGVTVKLGGVPATPAEISAAADSAGIPGKSEISEALLPAMLSALDDAKARAAANL